MAIEQPLLRLARTRIAQLNEKYRRASGSPFFLLHRPRSWNPQERIWMGYERKRGKLEDLNALLRGGPRGRCSLIAGDSEALSNVKYVITLDTDTQLPRDTARQFVAAMAHPLNRARYDEGRQRVCEGYGILQPRMAVSLPSTNSARYARLCGSEPGIDPYTRVVSDVYQDVFGEASFIGKIISDKADMTGALAAAFFGAVGTAGQRCTSTRRLIIHEKMFETFIAKLIANYKSVKSGDPLDPKTLMGPLIDEEAVSDFEQALMAVRRQGGKILYGGKVLNPPFGRRTFVLPTIVEIANDAPIVQTETFAPILYVMRYRTIDEAIAMHNSVPQGLSSGIFSDSVAEAEAFVSFRGSDCGRVV